MQRSITLRRLSPTPASLALVQTVVDCAPEYSRLTCGASPAPDAAVTLFQALPPGKHFEDKHVFAVYRDAKAVGVIDLIRGYPSNPKATLGLLLITESCQGAGVGREAYFLIEQVVRQWPEIRSVRIGVVETNAKVLPFWLRMGFTATGETQPYTEGSVTSRVLTLERALVGSA